MKRVATFLFMLMLAGFAEAQETRTFGNWWVACDIQRTCTAYGFNEDNHRFLRVRRSGVTPSPVIAETFKAHAESSESEDRFLPGSNSPGPDESFGNPPIVRLSAWFKRITSSKRDRFKLWLDQINKNLDARVPLGDAVAAFGWIDEYQGRAGYRSALILTGPEHDPDRPIPETKKKTTPLAPGPGAAAANPPAALAKLVDETEECKIPDEDEESGILVERLDGRDFRRMQLTATKTLWTANCYAERSSIISIFFYEEDEKFTPALFEIPAGIISDTALSSHILSQGWASENEKSVSSRDDMNYPRDCGHTWMWYWTGNTFELVSHSTMGPCGMTQDWPELLSPPRMSSEKWSDE